MILDERYFRRMDKFERDVQKFRGWLFDLLVALGSVDKELAIELKGLLYRDSKDADKSPEKWDPQEDKDLNNEIYEKYSHALYGILCSLTGGEAKTVLKGIVDAGSGQDGFKGMLVMNRRFDTRTSASLLQGYLDVVSPPGIKGTGDLVSGIHK